MAGKYKTLIHEWFGEVWNKGDVAAIDRLLDAKTVVHGITDASGNAVRGPEAFKMFHQQYLNAFPKVKVKVLDTVSEGDKIAARCLVSGKHEGDGLGFAATNKAVEFTGMCLARIKKGKIVEAWNNFDFLDMHQQLDSLKLFVK
jgi:steroid delta-isomerase-like uncharacterized protein